MFKNSKEHRFMQHKHTLLAYIALIIGSISIGFSPIFVKYSVLDGVATSFYRVGLSVPLFLIIWFIVPNNRNLLKKTHYTLKNVLLLSIAGISFAIDVALFNSSFQYTHVGEATLIVNSSPFFVTLMAFLLWNERISKRFVLALFLALIGAIFLTFPHIISHNNDTALPETRYLGDIYCLMAAFFYAVYIICIKELRKVFSVHALMLVTSFLSSITLLIIMAIQGNQLVPEPISWHTLWPLFGIAIISHTLGQGTISYGLAHLPASLSSLTLLIQPIIAAIAAYILFQETMLPLQILGGVIILAAILMAAFKKRAKAR